MRTLTKQQESYFDGLRRVGDDPLRSQLELLGTLNYENGVDYMKLVYHRVRTLARICWEIT